MCDSTFCSDFLTLLTSCDQRLSGHKKNDHSNFKELTKKEVDVILGYIQLWPQRQCMCCYRDIKNFDRFNFVIRSLIFLIVVKLKDVKTLIANTVKLELKNAEVKTNESSPTVDVTGEPSEIQQKSDNQNAEKKSKSIDGKEKNLEKNEKCDDVWILPDIEKALIFISKVFLLNFPLYVAHKHGIHGRIDEITPQDLQSLSMFCDIHDTEIPVYLYRNVTLFCTAGGFVAMLHCFELNNLPVSTAHACTMAISNIKLWLNYRSIVQLFVPLRIKILQYMCKLSDQDLRSSATKSMADFMWSAIKDPLDSQISFDTEGLALAFKYFTSSTLTMRLAGMSQINAHINLFNDICTTETVAEVELIGRKLADWLTENQIISHLFGPNLHVEVIKQSHIVLNFLAVENHITEEHVTLIWQAAQLKHCSKTIYDILPSLVKNLAPKPATHLYTLLCRLDPKEHTEQSIYIISALTKLIWARDRGRQMSVHDSTNISREIAEIQSSSENSVSVDGSNSEDDSSDCRKSPIDVDGSDSGAPPPCKQARHITTVTKKKGSDDTKAQAVNYNLEKDKRAIYPAIGARNDRFHTQNTSSDEESADVSESVLKARKKFRKRRRKIGHLTRKEIQEMVESISDGDSDCDPLFGGSDCSESVREDVLERLNKDESFFRAISENCHLMDYLRSAENDESSSPISNKSEKNMADFDDEDSPCEEELAQLTATSSHYSTSPRNRIDHNRSNTPNNLQKTHKNHVKNSGSSGNEKNKSNSSNVSSPMRARSPDVCQPGNTLLWDLLQDDKIGFLGEALALETEKTLSSLLCFHTEKFVRKKFIEACLTNIANNRSVIVSLRLIPKLLASFQQFRDVGTHQVTIWAERTHKMMHHFFNNLKCYCNHVKQLRTGTKSPADQPSITLVRNQNGNYFYSHTTQIQVRLQFLASIFCDIGSPKTFRLTTNQIDVLWSCLSSDPECADCLFHWLQGQAKGNAQHALSSQSLQHIYMKKWPELKPENISMVALTLFQQLFILGLSDELRNEKADVLGMDNLWKIALRANDTDVSMAAIQYINTYYMEHQLKNEKEFVAQCMNYLTQAADGLNKPEIEEQSIMCVQRALMLLNTHLETFRRRYAYHLRRWTLEGRGIISHSALRAEGPGPPIKIILQPGGLPEKSYLHLYQTDLVADLKAEIAKWWENLQGTIKSSGGAPVLGNLLSDGPLRIITQGQEITSEYDERSLIDVGFKDNQMVYVSLGGRSGRRRDHADHPSMLPAPSKDCLPTILLLQSPYFEQLFKLMQSLGDMKLTKKSGSTMQHTQAQVLSRRVWDILAMLPTSPTLLETFKNFSLADKSTKTDEKTFNIRDILDPSNLQKFMYSLHIVESLCKSKFAASVKNSSMTANQRNQLKMKIAKAKAAKKSASKENSDNSIEELKSSSEEKRSERENENGVNSRDQSDTDINISKEESSIEMKIKKSIEWSNQFIKSGGLEHLYEILMSGVLQKQDGNYNEWRYDCLCSLLRILCLLGVDDLKQEENIIVIPKLNDNMLKIMDVKCTIARISSILNEAAVPLKDNHYKTGFWGRSQVVNFAMNLLVCFAYSSQEARETLWIDTNNYSWLQKLILDDPDPHVRRETCAALYRLCMGNSKTYSELMIPLLVKLISFLPVAEKMKTQTNCYSIIEDGKEPYGQACRDYFWLLSRLVDNTTPDLIKSNIGEIQNNMTIDIEALCNQVSQLVMNRDYLEGRHIQDDGLVGLLNLMANLVKYDPPFKYSQGGQQFIAKIFECLFALPTAENRDLPKCKSQGARAASYDLLIELTRNAPSNYMLLHKMLMLQHRPGPHSPYPWDYWPRDDGRSECGYVGLTNLGATCYMASCIQHIFMMPQARESILSVPTDAPVKHKQTFSELQKMFAYLMESERKSYNPRSFCKVYQMDHQPLNTGEQKDMAEFFIDLVSKLEEMTPELKALVKQIFCGVISNNVVSLDCGHVSRTLEEFYTVRCQVADMRNLQESLDEVTVKDTLEGDNMYTCSQCGRKVRAEKRACFKKLPQILCFNTMRYTFNMVTMLKEKVNTHFSFPLRLDMSRYVEKTLMPHHYQEEKLKSQMRRKVSESESVQSTSNSEIKPKSEQMSQGDESQSETSMKADVDENEQIKQEQQIIEEEESEDFNENYEYDLVGVTVHTGTADGGHYYSFIKERDNGKGSPSDRWFLFNDAEVKLFDPSQIAAECFGGEMTSKTYDSVTEKYLDFSFEKTNSAYMLFYEWRSGKGEQRNQSESPTTLSPGSSVSQLQEAGKSDEAQASTSDHVMAADDKIETNSTLHLSEMVADCDIETKFPSMSLQARKADEDDTPSTSSLVKSKRKSLLNKDLEEWIWQDNRHYLEDRNIFEHTYFNFMWQICGHVPQSLLVLNDITFRAAQLSVSFFMETFIHAKEKPTMVLWVELLTKQFNASQEACEWFLQHMSQEPWWPVQVLIQCPNQMVRQMFQRLVIHVIQRLRPLHFNLYLQNETEEDGVEAIGEMSCVTKFIKSLILLLENGAKAHLRHLTEFFGLLYEFSRMGEEETKFLLQSNVIKSVADFYLGHKNQDCIDSTSDNDENSSDEALSVEKTRPVSLDKMIALVATLVERSRGTDHTLSLSPRDYNAIAGGKGFPFLYQQIKDNINPNQTRLLIHALCRYDERLASSIIAMLFNAVTKHTELCGPFFKLLTLLTESSSGPSGLPCFSQLVLQRVWDAAEFCPQPSLEWLAIQAPRNKVAHAWILSTAENWVEQFLIAHPNLRVRNAAANLLVSLIPSQSFRQNYRASTHHKMIVNNPQREISGEALIILHSVLSILLKLLRAAKNYTDISSHGTVKLTSYFGLMAYCMITKTEKLMLGPHIKTLWELFHPKLSEPSVPAHHNKQALLAFWHHATVDCPENAQQVVNNPEITKNIAFNYILADHDDSEVVQYNRSMLPAYYGLLRLCCQQSRTLTRQLAGHQNLQWAFKNITPHPTQYNLAVDELFKLMALFVAKYPDSTQTELDQICVFRRQTLSAYLSGLDARVSWNTLVSALRILVENEEDRLFFVSNGGLTMCFEALLTLHSMYHEATACNVTEDLQDLLREIVRLVQALRQSCREQKKKYPPSGYFKGLPEVIRRLTTLLNTFNPPEMRKLTLDVLKELVRCIPTEAIGILTPILTHCHIPSQQHSMGPLGTFFPRRNTKNSGQNSSPSGSWQSGSKNIPRPPRPMIQMNIPRTQAFTNVKGVDKEFDLAVERFYKPYHEFLDIFFRAAVTSNIFSETLVNLSLVTGVEAVGWHFNFFPTFWVGINKNKNTQRYTELFVNNCLIHEYIDRILKDERISLNDSMIANFIEIYYGKVRTQLSLVKLLDAICSSMVQKENWEEICGDLHAVRIIGQTGGFPKSTKENLKRSLQCVLQKSKDFASEVDAMSTSNERSHSSSEESPPKKRRIEGALNKANQASEEKSETPTEPKEANEIKDDKASVEMNEEIKSENESKETEKVSAAATSLTPTAAGSTSALISTRNDLIKDIESHIEIIYECLCDELNESGSTSSINKTASSEQMDVSSEVLSQDADKTVKETAEKENSETKVTNPPAQDESKSE